MGGGRWGSCGDGMVGVGDNPGETEECVDSDMNVALFFSSFRCEGIPR